MITTSIQHRSDGSVAIRVGRVRTILKTSAEGDAFLAGIKVAHLRIAKQIGELLAVKDDAALQQGTSHEG